MEQEHGAILSRRYHVKPPELGDGPSAAQVVVYSDAKAETLDAQGLLKLAVHLEKRARTFFLETGRAFPEGSPEWRRYRELEAEEREHIDVLETALRRRKAERTVLV
jgi:hypothetical protein